MLDAAGDAHVTGSSVSAAASAAAAALGRGLAAPSRAARRPPPRRLAYSRVTRPPRRRTRRASRGPCARARTRCRWRCRPRTGATARIASADVLRRQAAAEDQRDARAAAREQLPVQRLARAAAQVLVVRCRAGGSRCGTARRACRSAPPPTRAALMICAPVRRRTSSQYAGPSSPCSCTIVSPSASTCAVDLVERRVDEHAADLDLAAQRARDQLGLVQLARARRSGPEDQPDRPGADLDGALGVVEAGDAADLHAGCVGHPVIVADRPLRRRARGARARPAGARRASP